MFVWVQKRIQSCSQTDGHVIISLYFEETKVSLNKQGPGEKFNIVTIDKNNIFLGATVKNDDAKVIISRIVAGGAVQIDGRLREGTFYFIIFQKF